MASSIICLHPSLSTLAWTQHDIDHVLGLALTSPRFHHPFHLHELPPFLSRVLSSPASVVAFPLTPCPTRTLPCVSKTLCPLASRFGCDDTTTLTHDSHARFTTRLHATTHAYDERRRRQRTFVPTESMPPGKTPLI